MAKLSFARAEAVLWGCNLMHPVFNQHYVKRALDAVLEVDQTHIKIVKGVSAEDFEDDLEFYSWYFRYFVSENGVT